MVPLELAIALFIAGMAAGIALHRLLMAFILRKAPDSMCAYCEWMDRRKRYRKKKQREMDYLIYSNIVALCKERGISIARLERESGLGNATIRGRASASPTVDRLKRLADYLGVSVDQLVSENLEKQEDKERVE